MFHHSKSLCRASLFAMLLVSWLGSGLVAWGQLRFEPSWEPPTYEATRKLVFAWINDTAAEPQLAQRARSLWPSVALRELDGPDMLDLLVETAALLDERVANLVEQCQQSTSVHYPPDTTWVATGKLSGFVASNIQLYVARWAVQHTMFDDALVLTAELRLDEVVDPASLLFCRMVAHHQVVEPDQSRVALVQLLEQPERIPLRYRQVAELVRQDMAGLEDESLDHISRRMNDVRRRLDLGEAGKQVQVVEKGVVDALDKVIKKLEEQQQQSSGGGGSSQSSTPMQDSQLPSLQAPGKVDPRDVGHQAGWGDLPPKEREEALQQIGREFPAHYRQLIEQYFRDLANESSDTPEK